MARNEKIIGANPSTVFGVLSDPDSYGYWVVGSKEIRDADARFPAPGTRFHHTVGWGPLNLEDHTEVTSADPPHQLKLTARARPLGTARVTLELEEVAEGTRVTMIEDPADPLTAFVFNPLVHLLVRRRNTESLRRLGKLAESAAARAG